MSSLSYSVRWSATASKPLKPLFCPSPFSFCVLKSPQADLGTGAGISSTFPPCPCSDAEASPSPHLSARKIARSLAVATPTVCHQPSLCLTCWPVTSMLRVVIGYPWVSPECTDRGHSRPFCVSLAKCLGHSVSFCIQHEMGHRE
jgi:hypothetical protein